MAVWGGGGANTWREAFIKQFNPGNGSTIKMVEVPNPAGALRSPAAASQYNLALVTYFEAIALSNAGLIESFDDKQLPGIGDVDPKFLTKDKAGRHVGLPAYFTYYGIAFNTDLAKAQDFASWQGLADPKWKGKLSLTRPVYLAPSDAVIMDIVGYRKLWPGEPFKRGRIIEMNDRRAVIVGLAKARKTFQSFAVVYTRYSQAIRFAPPERKVLSFVLAEPAPGVAAAELAGRISARTGLQALSRDDFLAKTIRYYLLNTGIPINFGITVGLGFLVGTAIAGQTFYLFIVENLRQFGALKAMGTGNGTILLMVLAQALHVGFVGLGVGVGLAALFGWSTRSFSKLSFYMPWQVLVITGVAVFLIVLLASLLSIRRVFIVDPAIVFRG